LTEEISSYTIAQHQTYFRLRGEEVMSNGNIVNEEQGFVEFRRKVRSAEVLSAAMERLLLSLQFTGRVSVVVQNGRVFSSRATRKAISAGAMTPNPAAAGAWQTKHQSVADWGTSTDGKRSPGEQGTTAEASEGSIVE
jgi:hypothetical protein